MNSCYFCMEGRDFSIAKSKLGCQWPFDNDVVYSSGTVFAVIGFAPQVIPYILILPYRHIFSLSEMDADEWNGFIDCLKFLRNNGGYGEKICFFEHGGPSSSGASSIDHCHVHIINGHIGLYEKSDFAEYKLYNNITNLSALKNMEHYLLIGEFLENDTLNIKVSCGQTVRESQFFRRKLAEHIGSREWNWRSDNKIDRMISIMNEFKKDGKTEAFL